MNIKITLSSVLIATLCSGILVGMIYKMRKKKVLIKGYGIRCIVLLYLFCLVRVFLPLDLPFTKGISFGNEVYINAHKFLCMNQYPVWRFQLSIDQLLCVAWIVIAVIQLLRFLTDYYDMYRLFSKMSVREDSQCSEILEKVYKEKGGAKKVKVLYNKGILVPMGVGIRNWKILLPDKEYQDSELYYILLHEYTHHMNGDLKVKLLSSILCCVFWWNPFIYLLDKDLEQSLEIKCDLCVTEKMSFEETAEYLQTIVQTLKETGKQKKFSSLNGTVSLENGDQSEVKERFEFMINRQINRNKSKKSIVVLSLMFAFVWVLSYSLIPLPYYEPSIVDIETGPDAYELTPDNSYIINKDGKYFLYMQLGTEKIEVNEISEEAVELYKNSGYEIKEDVR